MYREITTLKSESDGKFLKILFTVKRTHFVWFKARTVLWLTVLVRLYTKQNLNTHAATCFKKAQLKKRYSFCQKKLRYSLTVIV